MRDFKGQKSPAIPLGMFFKTTLTLEPLQKKLKWPGPSYQYPDLEELVSPGERITFALGDGGTAGLRMYIKAEGVRTPKLSLEKYRAGDSLELFIDSRALQNSRVKHRFFHHFVLFPEAIEGISSRLFRFSGEKAAPIDNLVKVITDYDRNEVSYDITIPWGSLEGFDYDDKSAFGFGFRLNRSAMASICFPVQSDLIDRMPSLLARCEWSNTKP